MRFLRALSLDVVAGAACGGLLAEYVAQAHMRAGWWIALLTAVWSIYTGDHLLDARLGPRDPLTERHAFHRTHARALTMALAITVSIGLAAAFTLSPPVRHFGVGLSVAVVIYLASAQRLILPTLPKEPVAGVLYAIGIWGGPLLVGAEPTVWVLVAISLHAGAAILNLVTLGVFEADLDRSLGSRSLALLFGPQRVGRWISRASALLTLVALGCAAFGPPIARLPLAVLAAHTAMPGIILSAGAWFRVRDRYRTWGDSVFLLGALPRILA